MRSSHSFAINFIKRSSIGDKKNALLYARITLDGERAEISLKESIQTDDWDGHKELVKGKSSQVKSLNAHIEDVRFRIKSTYRELQQAGCFISAASIKQSYLGIHTQQKGHTLIDLW